VTLDRRGFDESLRLRLVQQSNSIVMVITNESTTATDQPAIKRPYGPIDVGALNLPNCITVSRLVLAFVLFAMISVGDLWLASTAVFIIAAATDAIDGYLARRYGLVTTLGRILDPFVDKIIVCGAFIFLVAIPKSESGIGPWMTLIVIGREMFITGLRSILESQGKDFSASMSGKIKMVLQCVAVAASLLSLTPSLKSVDSFILLRDVLLWLAVGFTFLSGILYIRRAARILRSP
jgi:CDP-diacylglycerol--glycerol-3-phosphate 3-phosphatidyltransferase